MSRLLLALALLSGPLAEVGVSGLGDSRISDSSRDFIFGDLDEDRDGVISAEELKEVGVLPRTPAFCSPHWL